MPVWMSSQVLGNGFLRLPILLTAVEDGDVPRISSSIKRCPPAPPLPGRLVGRLCWTWSRLQAQTAGCLGILAPASRQTRPWPTSCSQFRFPGYWTQAMALLCALLSGTLRSFSSAWLWTDDTLCGWQWLGLESPPECKDSISVLLLGRK